MKRQILLPLLCCLAFGATAQPRPAHNLRLDSLATSWDNGMPLGNGLIGALVWKKGDRLRLSLDRADLWDDRPMPGIDRLTFKWVQEKVQLHQYDSVQALGDEPYEANPAPTKIPGAAIEFPLQGLGRVTSNVLDIQSAINEIHFSSGAIFKTFVHADAPYGIFEISNAPAGFSPQISMPAYAAADHSGTANSVDGQSLQRLGYAAGSLQQADHLLRYHQPTHNGSYYEVLVTWQQLNNGTIAGWWTITNSSAAKAPALSAAFINTALARHRNWWSRYWSKSAVSIPEPLLEKQYYLDMYKFGAVARSNTPPISLQAVWTADNGKLPPWKGDFHHDLNTELSYWPGYTANHTDLTAGFTTWLWNTRQASRQWTKQYFGTGGMNVPGVNTISGKPMGGWIQYSFSPVTAAWLSQHFYWQWKYTGDRHFLLTRCKPWFDAVATYLRQIRVTDPVTGKYQHPLSSAPEYNDNDISAWFHQFTNYDLSLVRFFFEKYAEVTTACGLPATAIREELGKYPYFNTDSTGLTIAPGQQLAESHRHHSQLLGIYPLKIITIDKPGEQAIIQHSLAWLEKKGTRAWCGYSFSWAASIYAQAKDGEKAADMLRKFAGNFVGPNSFHLNGDQKGGQYSGFTYRPFTLEGNFAAAQGIHEMLLQSANGVMEIFPAIPAIWKEVAFSNLKTEDGWLVSANKASGEIRVSGNKPGTVKIKWAHKTVKFHSPAPHYDITDGILSFAYNGKGAITFSAE